MIARAEELFGPYEWDRYDMLVLPPAFPYGGMENPRMTFLTPPSSPGTARSWTLVAHELAHSWTGNLVTNADMEHFWLNEGFTVWAERRLLEALHARRRRCSPGRSARRRSEESLQRFGPGAPLTRLRTSSRNGPGRRLLLGAVREGRALRRPPSSGRRGGPGSTASCASTWRASRFTSITTEEFLAFLEERLPRTRRLGGCPGVAVRAGPADERARVSGRAGSRAWSASPRPSARRAAHRRNGRRLDPAETLVYLQNLPRELDHAGCAWLDAALDLSRRGNHEILVEWLTVAAGSGYEPAFPRLREVLTRVGRMKYLRPLYAGHGTPPPHPGARPGGLRRRRSPLPLPVPARGRVGHREVRGRPGVLSPRPDERAP